MQRARAWPADHKSGADLSRAEKTICLAVTLSLKAHGISGRARLLEVMQQVKAVDAERLAKIPGHAFTGQSSNAIALEEKPALKLDCIVATPRTAYYMESSY